MVRPTPLRWIAPALVCVALALAPHALGFAADGKGNAADGKKIFSVKCVACHRADGSGGVKLTGNPTPNWRDAKRMSDPKFGDAYLRDCMTNGKPKSGMLPVARLGVKPAQIDHLIAFIRTLARK